jgi:hypothetical protein
MVTPGATYHVTPAITPDETSQGLVLSPGVLEVTVGAEPYSGADFTQSKLKLQGSVECLAPGGCPADVSITLVRAESNKEVFQGYLQDLAASGGAPGAAVREFQIPNVAPGSYKLRAKRPGYCWGGVEVGEVAVAIEAEDATAPALQQSGFKLQIHNEAGESVRVSLGRDGAMGDVVASVAAKPGSSSVCLPGYEDYEVVLESCFRFQGQVHAPVGGQGQLKVVKGVAAKGGVPEVLKLVPVSADLEGVVKVRGGGGGRG